MILLHSIDEYIIHFFFCLNALPMKINVDIYLFNVVYNNLSNAIQFIYYYCK